MRLALKKTQTNKQKQMYEMIIKNTNTNKIVKHTPYKF